MTKRQGKSGTIDVKAREKGMATYNELHQELVYFDEPIKGDRLLITSRLISYRGKIIDPPAVERLMRIARTVSVNALPAGADFQLIVTSASAEITLDCARFGGAMWLGQGQFQRAGSALFEAAGKRLISEAIAKLRAGATLVWHHKPASFEKDSTVRLSHAGISIKQTGVIFNKALSTGWPQLKITEYNGRSIFQSHETKQKATIQTWCMSDNMTFLGVVKFLIDKANYRLLEPQAL